MNHSSHQVCTVTNPGLTKSLNSSSFHILLAQGHGLLVLANDFVTRWLAWNLTCPLDKWKLKRYLPNKKIDFSQMTRQGFFQTLQPLVGFSLMVSKARMNPIKGFWVQFLSRSKIFSLPRKVPWFPLLRPVKTNAQKVLGFRVNFISCPLCHSATWHNINMYPSLTFSPSQQTAVSLGTMIMTEEWVTRCWERRNEL